MKDNRLVFDAANLKPRSEVLHTIFTSEESAAAWSEERGAIQAVYGDRDYAGGVNPGDRRALFYLVLAFGSRDILEVGTHVAASTLHFARALRRLGSGGRVTTLDITDVNLPDGPWRLRELPGSPEDLATRLDCREQIDFTICPSLDYMSSTDKSFDLVFLDGDHTALAVCRDLSASLKLLRPGGIIVLHDFYPDQRPLFPDNHVISGPFEALAHVKSVNDAIVVLPLGTLPWPTKQGTSTTSLAIVCRDA